MTIEYVRIEPWIIWLIGIIVAACSGCSCGPKQINLDEVPQLDADQMKRLQQGPGTMDLEIGLGMVQDSHTQAIVYHLPPLRKAKLKDRLVALLPETFRLRVDLFANSTGIDVLEDVASFVMVSNTATIDDLFAGNALTQILILCNHSVTSRLVDLFAKDPAKEMPVGFMIERGMALDLWFDTPVSQANAKALAERFRKYDAITHIVVIRDNTFLAVGSTEMLDIYAGFWPDGIMFGVRPHEEGYDVAMGVERAARFVQQLRVARDNIKRPWPFNVPAMVLAGRAAEGDQRWDFSVALTSQIDIEVAGNVAFFGDDIEGIPEGFMVATLIDDATFTSLLERDGIPSMWKPLVRIVIDHITLTSVAPDQLRMYSAFDVTHMFDAPPRQQADTRLASILAGMIERGRLASKPTHRCGCRSDPAGSCLDRVPTPPPSATHHPVNARFVSDP